MGGGAAPFGAIPVKKEGWGVVPCARRDPEKEGNLELSLGGDPRVGPGGAAAAAPGAAPLPPLCAFAFSFAFSPQAMGVWVWVVGFFPC